jgi:hypothetical protein
MISKSSKRDGVFWACVALAVGFAAGAEAQSGNFDLELNSFSDVTEGCRLTFVATNNTGIALMKTSYQVAAFDGAGAVSALMVLEFGALPLSKTKVLQFDVPAMKCEAITRLLVNDQDSCESDAGKHDVCIKSLSASSRVPTIPFGL